MGDAIVKLGVPVITTLVAAELDAGYRVLATYEATMLLEPIGSVDVVYVAVPPESAPLPSSVLPELKFTVPVGVPCGEVTVALNTTGVP